MMKKGHFQRGLILSVLAIFLAGFSSVFGQEFRGTIAGNITDQNGAAVPGVSVTVQNTETNVSATATTNDDGAYTFPLLLPGTYKVTATAANFKTAVQENLQVTVGNRLAVDIQLQIGSTTEVSIVADSEVVERGSVTTGTLVTTRQIEELPLAEGAPYVLATQAPGINYTGDPNFTGPTANGNLAAFRSNGAAGNQINLDGSPNLAYSGQVAFTPPSDAVQEFKVQTNAFDAQNGFTAGSTVNVALKSGTNSLHGSVYLYDRAKNRTANNFFNNRAGRDRPGRQYNRYGLVLNGPVHIPYIYNGKDKTFFLFSYERQKDNVAQPQTYSVPTLKMRNGDFTELGSTLIYDPATAYNGNSTCGTTGTLNTICRTPFAGNIIPQSRIYAPAQAFLKLFPEPNLPGIINNYITDQNLIRPYRSYLGKIDHNFNDSNHLSGKYYHSRNTEDRYNLTGAPDSITRGFENRRNNGGNLDYTSTISSNFVFDVRSSYNQFKLKRFQDGQPTAASLGFNGIPASRRDTGVFPRFDFRNYLTLGSLRSDYNAGQERPFDLISVQPTLTQIVGNHTIKYGYDFRRLHERFQSDLYSSGRFLFDGTYTIQASNSGATARDLPGRDIASFLLGIPVASGNSIIDNPTQYDTSSVYNALFFHDDFRFTPKLTINLGFRYELESGVREKQGRIVTGFDRLAASPLRAAALANYTANAPANIPITTFQNLSGGLTFASGSSDANQTTDKNNIQPRFGISYAIDDKTVIRGGFGIFTQPFQIQAIFQPGFSTPTTFTPSTNNGLTITSTLANPFPNGVLASPGSSLGLATFAGRDLTSANAVGPSSVILSNERKNANFSRYVVGIQRELPYKFGIEATYIYSRGTNIAVSRELNAIPVQYLNNFSNVTDGAAILAAITAQNTFLNATVANPFRGLIPDVAAFNSATIARRRLLTPFPEFGNVAVTEYNGTSSYSSFQFQIVKRFTKGLSLNGSYTHSREHDKSRYLNPQDTELTDSISVNERPNRITFSSIYELPYGRGREYGKNLNPIIDAFLGGWQIQAVYERQSGEPLQFGNVYYNGDPKQLKSRLGEKDDQGRRYGIDIPAFDITGFYVGGIQLAANTPGYANNFTSSSTNTLRNFPFTLDNLRTQRFLKFDAGVSKNFRIREKMKFQIRVEAINLLNDPYFSAPTLDPTVLPTTTAAGINYLGTLGYTNAPTRQPPRDIQIGGRFTF